MGDHHVVRGHPTRFGKYWLWPVWLCGYQAYLAVVAGVDMAGVVVAGVVVAGVVVAGVVVWVPGAFVTVMANYL